MRRERVAMRRAGLTSAWQLSAVAVVALTWLVPIGTARAFDDHGPLNPPLLLPYNGVVELDGAAMSGQLKMRFTLDDNAAVERDLAAGDPPLWQDVVVVDLARGRFHVDLGAGAALPADLLQSDELFLGVDICRSGTSTSDCPDGDSAAWVILSSSKKFVPVPYAYMSAQSIDMKVNGDLQVTNDTRVDHDLTVGNNATVTGVLSAGSVSTGSLSASSLSVGGGTVTGCPNSSLANYGLCWQYHGGYIYTFKEAAAVCKTWGGHLCSRAQISALQAAGAQHCGAGWVSDRTDNSNGVVLYPMQTTDSNCGNAPGVHGWSLPFTSDSGANCCK